MTAGIVPNSTTRAVALSFPPCRREALRLLRRKNSESGMTDLTQADIANSAGISVRYYNKLENGKTLPTIDTLSRIAESYHLSLSEISKLIEEY